MNSLSPPHGEERRAAARLEPWAENASGATEAALVLRDDRLRCAKAVPQDEGGASAALWGGYALFNRSIAGRSPRAFAVIGGRGSLAMPGSISKVYSSEYHGPFTSGAGAGSFSCST